MIQIGEFKLALKNGDIYEIERFFKKYSCDDNEIPDSIVDITNEDLLDEKIFNSITKLDCVLAYNAFFRKFSEWLPLNNAFLIHGVLLEVENSGILFSAASGTGKTTHMLLWQKLLGEKLSLINGDKPIVRFFDDEPETPYAYGTPWKGKENFGFNGKTKLKHICFIERSETNYVEKVQKKDVIDRIFNQVYMPKDPVAIINTMQLIDRLLNCCNLWVIHCNMEPEAAEIAYNAIINGK